MPANVSIFKQETPTNTPCPRTTTPPLPLFATLFFINILFYGFEEQKVI